MKSSELTAQHQEEATIKKISLSEPGPVNLKPYEFNPTDIELLVTHYSNVDPHLDLKNAKKARTEIKKKIKEIKDVHMANKKIISQFQKDLVEYDFQKFELLSQDLTDLYNKIDAGINAIENGAKLREQSILTHIATTNGDISAKILNARTEEDIQMVQIEISNLDIDPANFDNHHQTMVSLKTRLMLAAASRANEIANAGGVIQENVDPLNLAPTSIEPHQKYTDGELLNFLESNGIPSKGWKVMISPVNGPALYQVDDPSAPKSIRMALQIAYEEYKSKSI